MSAILAPGSWPGGLWRWPGVQRGRATAELSVRLTRACCGSSLLDELEVGPSERLGEGSALPWSARLPRPIGVVGGCTVLPSSDAASSTDDSIDRDEDAEDDDEREVVLDE